MASTFTPTHKPCNLDYCSSGYGIRHINVSGASTQHRGFDIPGSGGAYSMAKGKVQEVAWNNARGWYIVIKHNTTYSTEYQHLAAKPTLKKGTSVKSGQRLGTIGSTGVGARHLHIEVRKNGSPIDPQPFLIKAFMPKKITHTLTEIKGYNHRALAWRWYLEVARLQTDLKKLGYYTGKVDGKFESGTTAAVKRFQKASKLTVDGSVGSKTIAALSKAVANYKAPAPAKSSAFKVKTLYNMKIRKSASTKGKVVKIVKKGSTLKITKTNSSKTWGYSSTAGGWVCIKTSKKTYCKKI